LAAMAAGISRGKKAYAEFDAELGAALAKLGSLGAELRAAIDADAASYQAVVAASKARKNASESQAQAAGEAVALALLGAASVPLRVAQCAAEVGALIQALRARTSPRMGSDLTVAMARAAMEGALANVEINLDSLQAEDAAEGRAAFIAETRATIAELRNRLQAMA